MELWSTVCKSKLLANATFILLLNKADLLAAKLKAGLKFEDYAVSYHGRPNKAEYVADCKRTLLTYLALRTLTRSARSPGTDDGHPSILFAEEATSACARNMRNREYFRLVLRSMLIQTGDRIPNSWELY